MFLMNYQHLLITIIKKHSLDKKNEDVKKGHRSENDELVFLM